MPSEPLYYGDYLELDRLLDSQHPRSGGIAGPAHDEMLFIIALQTHELWLKQILWELGAVLRRLEPEVVNERDVGCAVSHLERIVRIQHLLVEQLAVLETMTPLDFLDFRDRLYPASGVQSVQFRLIEVHLGLRESDRVLPGEAPITVRLSAEDRARVEAAAAQPSLFELVERWLERTPFLRFGDYDFWADYRIAVEETLAVEYRAIEDNPGLTATERAARLGGLRTTEARFKDLLDRDGPTSGCRFSHEALRAALLIHLYSDEPILRMPSRLLHALDQVDAGFAHWRTRHAQVAQRMIGGKPGTGGSSGYHYLRRAAESHRVFSDLSELATCLIPRSSLPPLPEAVRASMGFSWEGSR